jgi:hypothetical protein
VKSPFQLCERDVSGLFSWLTKLAVRMRARELIAAHGCPSRALEEVARLQADPGIDPNERAFLNSVAAWMAQRA